MAGKANPQEILAPYLETGGPDAKGEWPMHCLIHNDGKRSASVNFTLDAWFCHACYRGGTVAELLYILDQKDSDWVAAGDGGQGRETPAGAVPANASALPSAGTVAGWASALLANSGALTEFRQARGLTVQTIEEYEVGARAQYGRYIYTLPIYDAHHVLLNVRFYDLSPGSERRKIWGVPGHNAPVLYPIGQLSHDKIVICEGEWDALLSIQNGIPAITRTGAAKVWKTGWNASFQEKVVYLCHDMDKDGQLANRKVAHELRTLTSSVAIVKLPYPVTEKHGRDLTDYFHQDGHLADDFWRLADHATAQEGPEFVEVDLVDTMSAQRHGNRLLSTIVNVQSVQKAVYVVPQKVDLRCSQDNGKACSVCPMNSLGGSLDLTFRSDDSSLLGMMNVDNTAINNAIRKHVGIPKCAIVDIDITQRWDVSQVTVRPSVDHARVSTGQPAVGSRAFVVVGPYSNNPNTVFQMVGNIYNHPKTQLNTFQVSRSVPAQTSIDSFVLTADLKAGLPAFQPSEDQTPLEKAYDIARDMSDHVTHIYGRPDLHVLIDLVYHSALAFNFAGTLERRGWLDALVVGDTRTGKSEAASSLVLHYQAGEMVNCEGATFAGILGGVQQIVGNAWEITWGVIPQNDRRMVVLDEASSLTPGEFAQLSGVRSSGEAQLTKIQADKAQARTRLLWLANPRPAKYGTRKMQDYNYGVQAIQPLIVNPEDIARFDIAMSVRSDEVDPREINRLHTVGVQQYSTEMCRALVLWAWSRNVEDIIWTKGATAAAYREAMRLGSIYIEDPPLLQMANARMKIARLAVALAARTFSTDETFERVIVTAAHVRGAVQFIDNVYGSPNFGYKQLSTVWRRDFATSVRAADEAKQFIHDIPGLAKLLFQSGDSFRGNDLQEMLSISKDRADGIVSQLAVFCMIERGGPQNIILPLLRDIAKEIET